MKLFAVALLGFAITFPLLSSACSDKGGDGIQPPENSSKNANVTVTPETLTANFNPQTLELKVTADVDWSIRPMADWITVKPSGGVKNETSTIKVTFAENKEFDTRTSQLEIISGNATIKTIDVMQGFAMNAFPSISSVIFSNISSQKELTITSNADWALTCDANWLSINPSQGSKGETTVTLKTSANETETTRETTVSLICGDSTSEIKISQLSYNVSAPDGYSLVWCDEFDYSGKPSSDWVIENQSAGWVNNELQTYTSREIDGKLTLEVKDGFLYVNCFKGSDGKIYSGRMNAKPSTGWQYGYVEARINLPSGKGTWPAFWMMPSNVDWSSDPWPFCGEIDIMEEVGVDANKVSSSLHTGKYNHIEGTQKTHEMYLPGAEGEFHTYALEWTPDAITTYVDGQVQLSVKKSQMGTDHASWPFDRRFYPIVNLAWGGNWGGYKGVDESALPVTMLVDYIRIFQK